MILPRQVRSGSTPKTSCAAAVAEAEAGDHLVEDEERAVLPRELAQALQEAGRRRHDAHVPGDRLDDDGGDLVRGARRRAGGTASMSL